MFIDFTQVELFAGKGGAGVVSFRKEKYIPKGVKIESLPSDFTLPEVPFD